MRGVAVGFAEVWLFVGGVCAELMAQIVNATSAGHKNSGCDRILV